MGKVQCPNCKSYDTNEKTPPLVGCGCFSLVLSFLLLGGGAGVAQVYGGTFDSSPLLGGILFITGIIAIILGYFRKSRKQFEEYECKNCKLEFIVRDEER